MLWSAIAWGLVAAVFVSLMVPSGRYERLPAYHESTYSSALEAKQSARVGQDLYWRSAGIGLGVTVYKADNIAFSDIIRELTSDKQEFIWIECLRHIVLFFFKAAAYGWAIHCGIDTVASLYGPSKRNASAHSSTTKQGKATATKLKGPVGGDGLYSPPEH